MTDISKNVKIFIILMVVVGILLIGLIIDSYIYYDNLISSYSINGDVASTDYLIGHTINGLYFTLSMISFFGQIIFTFLFLLFSLKRKSWCWFGSIILISYITIHKTHRLIINSGRHIIDDSINWTFSIIAQIVLIFIGVYIIYLLTRPDVKKYFKKA